MVRDSEGAPIQNGAFLPSVCGGLTSGLPRTLAVCGTGPSPCSTRTWAPWAASSSSRMGHLLPGTEMPHGPQAASYETAHREEVLLTMCLLQRV